MASITIRNLDDNLKEQLRLRAAQHGRSTESEARMLLSQSLNTTGGGSSLAVVLHQRFAAFDIKALPVPSRQPVRTPPDFGE